jgi:pimeloyl-ACP methyl ester carboxylesterase
MEIVFFPGWSGLPKQSYNPLLKRFEKLGVKTHTVPYKLGGTGSIKGTANLFDTWRNDNMFAGELTTPFVYIGHSMGGLVARHSVQHLGHKPDAYVSLGTPHQGVGYYDLLPHWGPFAAAKEMRAGSVYLQRLNALEWPTDVPGMTLEGSWDFVVPDGTYIPLKNEKIPHQTHAGLLWSERTFLEIGAFLSYELGLFSF